MAKISAHGATKLEERSFDTSVSSGNTDFFGDTVRHFYVLRSDGAILRASSYPSANTSYDRKRSGYTVAGKIKAGSDFSAVFNRYVDKRAQAYQTTGVK